MSECPTKPDLAGKEKTGLTAGRSPVVGASGWLFFAGEGKSFPQAVGGGPAACGLFRRFLWRAARSPRCRVRGLAGGIGSGPAATVRTERPPRCVAFRRERPTTVRADPAAGRLYGSGRDKHAAPFPNSGQRSGSYQAADCDNVLPKGGGGFLDSQGLVCSHGGHGSLSLRERSSGKNSVNEYT
jgi:hypothetical protein